MSLSLPPGFVAVPLKGAVLVIPARVYVAGLKLGKVLKRREAQDRRSRTEHSGAAESPAGKAMTPDATALVRFTAPPLPAVWDYETSVETVKQAVYKWHRMTQEILGELAVARGMLSQRAEDQPRSTGGTFVPAVRTWSDYCRDIGSSRQVVNRWLLAVERQLTNGNGRRPPHTVHHDAGP